MKFIKNAFVAAKAMPKGIWVAAVILPGGMTAVGIFVATKSLYKVLKSKYDEFSSRVR